MAATTQTQPYFLTWKSWRCKQLTSRDLLAFVTMFLGGCLCMVRILPAMCCLGPHVLHPDMQQPQRQLQQQVYHSQTVCTGLGYAWARSRPMDCAARAGHGSECRSWTFSWRLTCGCWAGLPAWALLHTRDSRGCGLTQWILAWHRRVAIVVGAALQVSLANVVVAWSIGCLVIAWHPLVALLGMLLTMASLPGWQHPLPPMGAPKAAPPTSTSSTAPPGAAGWWRWRLLWRPPGWHWQQPGVRTAALLLVRLVSSSIPWMVQGPLRPQEPYLQLLPYTHLSYYMQFAWCGWLAYTLPVFGAWQVVAGLLSWAPMAYAASNAEPFTGSWVPHLRLWASSLLLVVLLPVLGTGLLERSLRQQYAQLTRLAEASKAGMPQSKCHHPLGAAAPATQHTEPCHSTQKACSSSSSSTSKGGSKSSSNSSSSMSSTGKGSGQVHAFACAGVADEHMEVHALASLLLEAPALDVGPTAAVVPARPHTSTPTPANHSTGQLLSLAGDVEPLMQTGTPPRGPHAARVLPQAAAAARPAVPIPAAVARGMPVSRHSNLGGSSSSGGGGHSGSGSSSGGTQNRQVVGQQQQQLQVRHVLQQQWQRLHHHQQQQQHPDMRPDVSSRQQQQPPHVRPDVSFRQHLQVALGATAAESILAATAPAAEASMVYVPVCRILPVGVKVGPYHDVAQLEPTLNECVRTCLDEELQLQQQQQQQWQQSQRQQQEQPNQQEANGHLLQHSLPVLMETVCFQGCVQLLASVYHARRPFLSWQQQQAQPLPPPPAPESEEEAPATRPASARPESPARSESTAASGSWDASYMARRLLQLVGQALPQPISISSSSSSAPDPGAAGPSANPSLQVAVGPAGAALAPEQPGGLGAVGCPSPVNPPVRLLWQDRAAVAAGEEGQVVTLVLDLEEHSIRSSSSSRHRSSSDWGSSGRSSPCGGGLLAGTDTSGLAERALLPEARHPTCGHHVQGAGCSSSDDDVEDQDGELGIGEAPGMVCTPTSSRASQQCSEQQELSLSAPMVRVLLSSQQQVLLDVQVPLQPYVRVVLPRLELGSYHLAIVLADTDTAAAAARQNAAAPLLLQPLLVLPPAAAQEVQQLWETVCGMLAPASVASAALHTQAGAAGSNSDPRQSMDVPDSPPGNAVAASSCSSSSVSSSASWGRQRAEHSLSSSWHHVSSPKGAAAGGPASSTTSRSSGDFATHSGAPASHTSQLLQLPCVITASAGPTELVAQQYKAIAWQAVVAGLVQDVGYVVSWCTASASLHGRRGPTAAPQQHAVADECGSAHFPSPPGLQGGGSCMAEPQEGGAANEGGRVAGQVGAAPLEDPAASVLGMLDLQGVLQPLLQYLAVHSMHAVAHALVNLVLSHSRADGEPGTQLPQQQPPEPEQAACQLSSSSSSSEKDNRGVIGPGHAPPAPSSLAASVLQEPERARQLVAADAAAAAAATTANPGAMAVCDVMQQQQQQETAEAEVTSDTSSWDSCFCDKALCSKLIANVPGIGAMPAASVTSAGVGQGPVAAAALAAAVVLEGLQLSDLAVESAGGWRVAARQLLHGFTHPQLESAFLRYMYFTTLRVDRLSAVFYPLFAVTLLLQDGLPSVAALGGGWAALAPLRTEVRFLAICVLPPLLLLLVRPYLVVGNRRDWAIVLWELVLVGVVWVSLWDGLGVAEHLATAIGMTPGGTLSLAQQMCVFKVLNKQVRFRTLMPPFVLECLGHILLLRQRSGAALGGLLLRQGVVLVLGGLHAAVNEWGNRRRFLSSAAALEWRAPVSARPLGRVAPVIRRLLGTALPAAGPLAGALHPRRMRQW